MKKETRTVVYDDELRLEAYRFEGIVQGTYALCLQSLFGEQLSYRLKSYW